MTECDWYILAAVALWNGARCFPWRMRTRRSQLRLSALTRLVGSPAAVSLSLRPA